MLCPNCGTELQTGTANCSNCGADLRESITSPRPAPPLQNSPPPSPLQPPKPRRSCLSWLLIAAMAIAGAFVVIMLLAIPSFLKFQAKARQSEPKINLGGIFTAEAGYFGEKNRFAASFDAMSWRPEGSFGPDPAPGGRTRYAYFLPGQVIQPQIGGPFELPPEIKPEVSEKGFTAVAVGNIDGDKTLDVWTINDSKILENVRNDVTQ
jgi:hypothetical protein